MKPFKILTDDYFIGNIGSIEATDEIVRVCDRNFLNSSSTQEGSFVTTEGNFIVDHRMRKCKTNWIPTNQFNFIEHGLKSIVNNVNRMKWNMDLDNVWESNIQYTQYTGKGHFYDWHQDAYASKVELVKGRKISIVYCLSYKTDYVGGEFQIKRNDGTTYTRKFNYGDFIVFPSYIMHRVKPLKSGNRTTLVGWYM